MARGLIGKNEESDQEEKLSSLHSSGVSAAQSNSSKFYVEREKKIKNYIDELMRGSTIMRKSNKSNSGRPSRLKDIDVQKNESKVEGELSSLQDYSEDEEDWRGGGGGESKMVKKSDPEFLKIRENMKKRAELLEEKRQKRENRGKYDLSNFDDGQQQFDDNEPFDQFESSGQYSAFSKVKKSTGGLKLPLTQKLGVSEFSSAEKSQSPYGKFESTMKSNQRSRGGLGQRSGDSGFPIQEKLSRLYEESEQGLDKSSRNQTKRSNNLRSQNWMGGRNQSNLGHSDGLSDSEIPENFNDIRYKEQTSRSQSRLEDRLKATKSSRFGGDDADLGPPGQSDLNNLDAASGDQDFSRKSIIDMSREERASVLKSDIEESLKLVDRSKDLIESDDYEVGQLYPYSPEMDNTERSRTQGVVENPEYSESLQGPHTDFGGSSISKGRLQMSRDLAKRSRKNNPISPSGFNQLFVQDPISEIEEELKSSPNLEDGTLAESGRQNNISQSRDLEESRREAAGLPSSYLNRRRLNSKRRLQASRSRTSSRKQNVIINSQKSILKNFIIQSPKYENEDNKSSKDEKTQSQTNEPQTSRTANNNSKDIEVEETGIQDLQRKLVVEKQEEEDYPAYPSNLLNDRRRMRRFHENLKTEQSTEGIELDSINPVIQETYKTETHRQGSTIQQQPETHRRGFEQQSSEKKPPKKRTYLAPPSPRYAQSTSNKSSKNALSSNRGSQLEADSHLLSYKKYPAQSQGRRSQASQEAFYDNLVDSMNIIQQQFSSNLSKSKNSRKEQYGAEQSDPRSQIGALPNSDPHSGVKIDSTYRGHHNEPESTQRDIPHPNRAERSPEGLGKPNTSSLMVDGLLRPSDTPFDANLEEGMFSSRNNTSRRSIPRGIPKATPTNTSSRHELSTDALSIDPNGAIDQAQLDIVLKKFYSILTRPAENGIQKRSLETILYLINFYQNYIKKLKIEKIENFEVLRKKEEKIASLGNKSSELETDLQFWKRKAEELETKLERTRIEGREVEQRYNESIQKYKQMVDETSQGYTNAKENELTLSEKLSNLKIEYEALLTENIEAKGDAAKYKGMLKGLMEENDRLNIEINSVRGRTEMLFREKELLQNKVLDLELGQKELHIVKSELQTYKEVNQKLKGSVEDLINEVCKWKLQVKELESKNKYLDEMNMMYKYQQKADLGKFADTVPGGALGMGGGVGGVPMQVGGSSRPIVGELGGFGKAFDQTGDRRVGGQGGGQYVTIGGNLGQNRVDDMLPPPLPIDKSPGLARMTGNGTGFPERPIDNRDTIQMEKEFMKSASEQGIDLKDNKLLEKFKNQYIEIEKSYQQKKASLEFGGRINHSPAPPIPHYPSSTQEYPSKMNPGDNQSTQNPYLQGTPQETSESFRRRNHPSYQSAGREMLTDGFNEPESTQKKLRGSRNLKMRSSQNQAERYGSRAKKRDEGYDLISNQLKGEQSTSKKMRRPQDLMNFPAHYNVEKNKGNIQRIDKELSEFQEKKKMLECQICKLPMRPKSLKVSNLVLRFFPYLFFFSSFFVLLGETQQLDEFYVFL